MDGNSLVPLLCYHLPPPPLLQRLTGHLHNKRFPPYVINLDPAVHEVPFPANIGECLQSFSELANSTCIFFGFVFVPEQASSFLRFIPLFILMVPKFVSFLFTCILSV